MYLFGLNAHLEALQGFLDILLVDEENLVSTWRMHVKLQSRIELIDFLSLDLR